MVVGSVATAATTAVQLRKVLTELDTLNVKFVAIAEGFAGDEVTRVVVAALAQAEEATRRAGMIEGIEEK